LHRRAAGAPAVINLSRALAKPHLRVAAFDDGPFRRGDRYAPLAGVVYDTPGTIESVRLGTVRVDARDATEMLGRWLRRPPFGPDVRAVLLDGITVGGFNLVDVEALSRISGRPVVALTRTAPDLPAMRRAIAQYFPRTRAARQRVIGRAPPHRVVLRDRTRFVTAAGCTLMEARALLERTTVRGAWPEPLRVAGLLARAVPPRAARRSQMGDPV
jgi:endonuclease V-like protein UPF0215 family